MPADVMVLAVSPDRSQVPLRPASPRRRLAVAAAVTALVALALAGTVGRPSARPAIGTERPATTQSGAPVAHEPASPAAAQARRDGVDVHSVVDTVAHRITTSPTGALVTHDDRYRAAFDAHGFELGLHSRSAAARVSTTELVRGATPIARHLGSWHSSSNVAERSLASGIVERVTAAQGRVEWDVVVASRLAGRGDLRIDADVTGTASKPRRRAGAWQWDMGGGSHLVMGDLLVRNSAGAVLYRAMPMASRSAVSLTVPAAVLDRAAYPLAVDPTVSAEYPVSDPLSTSAAGSQDGAAVAFDGTNYLVAWADTRSGASDIYAARVSKAGAVLDSTGIAVSTGAGAQTTPTVAFDGTNYLVAWADERSGASDIYGARVTKAGLVLDRAGIPISTATNSQSDPAVAFDGTNYLVTWTNDNATDSDSDVFGTRVSMDGAVLDGGGFVISSASSFQIEPAVAFDGTNCLVVWTDGRSGGASATFGARVSKAGTVLDPNGFRISSSPGATGEPALAFDGTNFLVVWTDLRSGADTSDLYGARVTPSGHVLDTANLAISIAANAQANPSVAFDGTNTLVTWTDNRTGAGIHIYETRVSKAGTVLDNTGVPISTAAIDQVGPAVASDGTNSLVVWADNRTSSTRTHIYGARVAKAGTVVDTAGILVSRSANAQADPAVAFDGTNYFVVWADNRSTDTDIYGARVSPSGTILDGTGIAISTAASNQTQPVVAFDGTNYLVAWTDSRSGGNLDIYATRVSTAGTVLNRTGIPITTTGGDEDEPAIAFDGTNSLIAWTDRAGPGSDLLAARVSKAGTVLDPTAITIARSAPCDPGVFTGESQPAIDFDGTNYLVAWTDQRCDYARGISGARVTKAGTVLGTGRIRISATGGDRSEPALAFDGTRSLVVWTDGSGPDDSIRGARVSTAGAVLDAPSIVISGASGDQNEPAVTANGPFLVVWSDTRSGTSTDIYGTRVDGNGSVLDESGILVATGSTGGTRPAVVPGAGSTFGAAYQRFAPASPYGAPRVFLRTVAPK